MNQFGFIMNAWRKTHKRLEVIFSPKNVNAKR